MATFMQKKEFVSETSGYQKHRINQISPKKLLAVALHNDSEQQ
jgi:hypothetical protein